MFDSFARGVVARCASRGREDDLFLGLHVLLNAIFEKGDTDSTCSVNEHTCHESVSPDGQIGTVLCWMEAAIGSAMTLPLPYRKLQNTESLLRSAIIVVIAWPPKLNTGCDKRLGKWVEAGRSARLNTVSGPPLPR